MERKEETVVLCGANSYDEKYYLNPRFGNLPKQIQDELKVMCVLYTNDVGGILLLEFDKDGYLHFALRPQRMIRPTTRLVRC